MNRLKTRNKRGNSSLTKEKLAAVRENKKTKVGLQKVKCLRPDLKKKINSITKIL